jgi:ammonium transporter Rh
LFFFYLKQKNSLINSDFSTAAILISMGAVLGRASYSQLIVMATIEVTVQVVNKYIGAKHIKVSYILYQ